MCSLTCPKGLDPRRALQHLKELYNEYKERKEHEMSTIWGSIKHCFSLIFNKVYKSYKVNPSLFIKLNYSFNIISIF